MIMVVVVVRGGAAFSLGNEDLLCDHIQTVLYLQLTLSMPVSMVMEVLSFSGRKKGKTSYWPAGPPAQPVEKDHQ